MNSSVHLLPLRSIQSGLNLGEFTLDELYTSFVNGLNKSESVEAWEVVSRSIDFNGKSFEPLSGLFLGVKDNIATKDFPTTMGSPLWAGSTNGFDARVVSKLRASGATIVGKTKCSAFAVHDTTGTLNPRYPDSEPGTSSSGSAAAVASNQISIALGTQTAGSIVKPASYCGVIGYKPTFGDIPRTGVLKTTEMFDSVGFFGRRILDISDVYLSSRVSGKDHPIHESRRRNENEIVLKKGLILSGDGVDKPSTVLRSRFKRTVEEIASDLQLELTCLDDFDFENLRQNLFTVYYKELSYYLTVQNLNDGLSKNMQEIIRYGKEVKDAEYESAKNNIYLWREFIQTASLNSVIFSLSASSSAPKIGKQDLVDANFFITSAGLPQLSIPLLRDFDGKIVNISISSPRYSDEKLLAIGQRVFPQDALELNSVS